MDGLSPALECTQQLVTSPAVCNGGLIGIYAIVRAPCVPCRLSLVHVLIFFMVY
jgi:hypothetical protein